MRTLAAAAAALGAVALPAAAVTPAPAAAAPAAGVSFAASTPPEPIRAAPGARVHTWLRLSNGGPAPIELRTRVVRLVPRDNGQLEAVDRADPLWTDRVRLASAATVPARAHVRVPVRIDVPAESLPDLYLVGVLVEAARQDPPAGVVTVRGQLVAMFTVEVPGARERELAVELSPLPRVQVGRGVSGSLALRNVGAAAAMARGQVRVDSATDGANQAVIAASGERTRLVPAGTRQEFRYTWRTDRWFTLVRPTALVTYGNGGASLGEVAVQGRPVLLVSPELVALVAAVGAAAVAAGVWALVRRRRRDPAHAR